jgi:hypothetical protein
MLVVLTVFSATDLLADYLVAAERRNYSLGKAEYWRVETFPQRDTFCQGIFRILHDKLRRFPPHPDK